MRLQDRLPDSRSIARRAPAFAGFAFGVLFPLLVVGLFQAVHSGGLSDGPAPSNSVSWLP